jgi:hypothetical protein
MHEHSYLLFGDERWAIAHQSIARVEGVTGVNTPDFIDLAAWGIDSQLSDSRGHMLRLETDSFQLSLLVYGRLKSVQVRSDQIIEMPVKFFASSPACALILCEEHHLPALLIDPAKLYPSGQFTSSRAVGEKT